MREADAQAAAQDMFPLPREADEPDETQINTHVRNEVRAISPTCSPPARLPCL